MKAFAERGLDKAGIKLIATGDVTDDDVIDAMGDAALGVITTHHYSAAHKSPENDAFKKAYAEVTGASARPNFMAVGGWDGMHLIYEMAGKIGGPIDAGKALAAVKGMTIQSPRGTITIDPATRDVVQDVYVRKVQKVDGKLLQRRVRQDRQGQGPGEVVASEQPDRAWLHSSASSSTASRTGACCS